MTVVFDGRSDVWGGGAVPSPVQIIFSREESADEKIIRMVEEAEHKKNIVVVTDDRALQYAVRALGAKVSGVQTFLGQGAPVPVRRPESNKNISKTLEHKITSEFARIWVPRGSSPLGDLWLREEKKKGKKT